MGRPVWLAIVAGSISAAGGAWWLASRSDRGTGESPPQSLLNCPRLLDLGTVEIHRSVEPILPISNTGGRPLTIRSITTSCGCLGVYLLPRREQLSHASSLTIPPGGEVKLAFSLRVAGAHGVKGAHTARFATDDPQHPAVEVRLVFIPVARYFSDPATVSLGEIPAASSPSATTVGLFSTDLQDVPAVREVVSGDPTRVRVAAIPESATTLPIPADGTPGSRRFGRVRVEVVDAKPGDVINTHVRVFATGRVEPVLTFPVTANIATPVRLSPAVLYFPRSSSNGPLYSGVVQCRGAGTEPLSIVSVVAPPGITTRVESVPGNPATQRILVECDHLKTAETEATVTIIARQGERKSELELRVVIGRP